MQLSVNRDELYMLQEGLEMYQKRCLAIIAGKQTNEPASILVREAQREIESALAAAHVIVQIKALLEQSKVPA